MNEDNTTEPGTALNAPPPSDVAPIEDKLTLHPDKDTGPTGGDGRPDGFVVGDQTAAGALTPPGGQHPGEPAGIPGNPGNLLDPHNVNGSIRNGELLEAGEGLENPEIDKETGASVAKDDDTHD